MTELNRRERYILANTLDSTIRQLNASGDFPERDLFRKLSSKVRRWIYEVDGDITSDEGVGEV